MAKFNRKPVEKEVDVTDYDDVEISVQLDDDVVLQMDLDEGKTNSEMDFVVEYDDMQQDKSKSVETVVKKTEKKTSSEKTVEKKVRNERMSEKMNLKEKLIEINNRNNETITMIEDLLVKKATSENLTNCTIEVDEEPSQAVINYLKNNGLTVNITNQTNELVELFIEWS